MIATPALQGTEEKFRHTLDVRALSHPTEKPQMVERVDAYHPDLCGLFGYSFASLAA